MRGIKFKMIISGEECGIDMPVSTDSVIEACGYVPSELVIAYYENGIFYEDSSKSVEIQGASDKVYIDNATGGMFVWDQALSQYKAVGGSLDVYTKSETDNKIIEKVSEIVAGAPEDFDTLKEMSDWIANHEGSAAAMNSAINANAENIANLQSETIRADDADSEGKCQLYKTVNGKRVNVEPKVSGGGLTTTYAEFAARVACWDFPDGVMVIPDGITSIGDYAFYASSSSGVQKYESIKSITIPNSVTSIGTSAFNGCSSLESVNIPESVTNIGAYAFDGCERLTSITIPGSVSSIERGAFQSCSSLASIIIGKGVTRIGQSAFQNCTGLTSITIPDSVTSIGVDAFFNCNRVRELIIAEGSETVTSSMVICRNSLKSVIIPDSVTNIGSGAFKGCERLTSIIIPDSVTSIGVEAFYNCQSLADIYYTGTQTQWDAITKGSNWNYRIGSSVSGGTVIHYNYIDTPYNVYGVDWDGSSSTKLTRTDDAAGFENPTPALNGVGGSSPFDGCYPWSDVEKVTIDGNVMVKIPKFWYKITKIGNSISFQIADGPVVGFSVSPAHADRGDGVGERDYVYIGRYKCTSSSYKSVTNTTLKTGDSRATARSGITSLGSGYYMQDFALWWTVRMLYLVEFANWNSQAVIGYGGGDSSIVNTGTTDSMSYHTGTMKSSRTTYGTGVQYRWIEDPWGNAYEWCDGMRFSGSDIYVYNNPSEYSDTSGGTKTGTRPTSNGYISQWSIPSLPGYDWALYPSAINGSESTYVADYCSYYSSGVVLYVGDDHANDQNHGAFYLDGGKSASSGSSTIGTRLQYLPG